MHNGAETGATCLQKFIDNSFLPVKPLHRLFIRSEYGELLRQNLPVDLALLTKEQKICIVRMVYTHVEAGLVSSPLVLNNPDNFFHENGVLLLSPSPLHTNTDRAHTELFKQPFSTITSAQVLVTNGLSPGAGENVWPAHVNVPHPVRGWSSLSVHEQALLFQFVYDHPSVNWQRLAANCYQWMPSSLLEVDMVIQSMELKARAAENAPPENAAPVPADDAAVAPPADAQLAAPPAASRPAAARPAASRPVAARPVPARPAAALPAGVTLISQCCPDNPCSCVELCIRVPCVTCLQQQVICYDICMLCAEHS